MSFARIPFVGGPLDGGTSDHQIVPLNGQELTHESHSYEFDLAEWSWVYKQRWQNVEHAGQVVPFRTYTELLFQLSRLMAAGKITAVQSLEAQQKVVARYGRDFLKWQTNYGKDANANKL